jgi:hypothetical protein
MSVTVNTIRQEARRLTTARKKNAKGYAKGKVFSGPRKRKLRVRA